MFSVIYRFKIKEGSENKFQECWAKVTEEFKSLHGGLGSCLHASDDNLFVAYARWPDRASWEKEKIFKDTASVEGMNDCIEKQFEPILMSVVNDLLLA